MAPDAAVSLLRRAAGALLALSIALPAGAQMFVCTTKEGRTITGSVPPQECKDRDVRELNPDGSTHRVIPAPLTREQRKQRDKEREEQRLQEESELAQAHRDRSLLETYASVEEIESARRRALAGRQMLVDRADQRLAQYARERKRLDDEAEFYAKREMPTKLKEAYETNKALSRQQEKSKADAQQEMKGINEHFDADRKRFEELEKAAAEAAAARERAESGQDAGGGR